MSEAAVAERLPVLFKTSLALVDNFCLALSFLKFSMIFFQTRYTYCNIYVRVLRQVLTLI